MIRQQSLHKERSQSYTRFIMLGLPRTGTNLLHILLDSHPAIMSMGEIFNRLVPLEKTICNYDLCSHQGGMPNAYECRLKDPISFIERYIFQLYSNEILAVGFKVAGADGPVWGYLQKLNDLKVTRINRKNYLQMLVSFMIAMKTKAWTSKMFTKRFSGQR